MFDALHFDARAARRRFADFEPFDLAEPLSRDEARRLEDDEPRVEPLPSAGRPAIGHSAVPTVGRVMASTAVRVFSALSTQLR
jgi:hypothetical protein